jgi:hypothetical protein
MPGCIGKQRVMLNAAGRRSGERGYCECESYAAGGRFQVCLGRRSIQLAALAGFGFGRGRGEEFP